MEQRREMTKKNKTNLRILQIVLLILIFASFIPGILNAGQMLLDEDESRVWGFAYSLFGVDWSTYMKQNSLISFGYSILLAPVIAVLQGRPGAIYKAAVLGNGIVSCLSYLLLLYIASRLFPRKDRRLLSGLCAGIFFLPGVAAVKYAAVPDMIIMLLICGAVACMVSMEEEAKTWKAVLFVVMAAIGTWFHAGMICVTIASFLVLYHWYKTRKLKENTILCMGILGVSVVGGGFLIEKIWLYQISSNTLLGLKGSMEVFVTTVLEAWNSQGLLEGIEAILVKGFVLGLATILLIYPGIGKIFKREGAKPTIRLFLMSAFALTLCAMSFYHVGTGRTAALADVRILMPYAGIFSIAGVVCLLEGKEQKLWISACFFGILTILAFNTLSGVSMANTSAFSSILFTNVFEMDGDVLGGRIYLAALVALVLFILSFQLALAGKKIHSRHMYQTLGLIAGVAGLSVVNGFVFCQDVLEETKLRENRYENIVAALSQNQEEIPLFYLKEGKSQDEEIVRLQYLCGRKQILLLESKKQSLSDYEKAQISYYQEIRKEGMPFYGLVSAESPHIRRYAEEYRMVELSDSYAVLTEKGSLAEQLSKEIVSDRIHVVGDEQELNLAPGTYEATVEVREDALGDSREGKLRVLEDGKVMKTTALEFNQAAKGKALAGINFSSDTILDNVTFVAVNSNGEEIPIETTAYRKSDVVYTIGVNEETELRSICNRILSIDENGVGKGSVGVICDGELGDSYNSLEFLKTVLDGYEIDSLDKEEKSSYDYLICPTVTGAYYYFMEDYSLIEKNSGFVLMVQNESQRYEKLASDETAILSDGYLLNYQGLSKRKGSEAISLDRGNYRYVIQLEAEGIDTAEDPEIGQVVLKEGKRKLASYKLRAEDFDENGRAQIGLVLNTADNLKSLTYEVRAEGQVSIEAEPMGVELLADKYEVGSEEEDGLKGLLEKVNQIDETSRIYYVTSVREREEKQFSLKDIQEMAEEHPITVASKSEVKYIKEDCYLLLRGFSSSSMDLAKYYTMIAVQGDYSLWVTNHGSLMAEVLNRGMGVMNSGERFPAALLRQDESMEENELGPLRKGTYEASITIKGLDQGAQDNLVLQIVQSKSEKEINDGIDEVMQMQIETGELAPDAMENPEERARLREILGTEFVLESYELLPSIYQRSGQCNVMISFTVETTAEKISLETVTSKNSEINANIEWIQKID